MQLVIVLPKPKTNLISLQLSFLFSIGVPITAIVICERTAIGTSLHVPISAICTCWKDDFLSKTREKGNWMLFGACFVVLLLAGICRAKQWPASW